MGRSLSRGMGQWGTEGPGLRTKGFPRKELSSVQRAKRTNPTATWSWRRLMLAKAMRRATRAPTTIAARKPRSRLLVV